MITRLRTRRVIRHPDIDPNDCFVIEGQPATTGYMPVKSITADGRGIKLTTEKATIEIPWTMVEWSESTPDTKAKKGA